MKSILYLFLFISIQINAMPVILNNTDRHSQLYSDIIECLSDDLGLTDAGISIIVVSNDFNKAINEQGGSLSVNDNIYVINVSNTRLQREIARIFIHELIHVSQCHQGRLRIHPGYIWFEGEFIQKSVNEADRAYEKEAWEKTHGLYRKFINSIKDANNRN